MQLEQLAIGDEELAAIKELKDSYAVFVLETTSIFNRRHVLHGEELKRTLNSDLESGIFQRYEMVSARAERLLTLKQRERNTGGTGQTNSSFVLYPIFCTYSVIFAGF